MEEKHQFKNRPASTAIPVRCLAPDLRRVWDVDADRSYDIPCHRPERQWVTIRTLAGVGEVQLHGRSPITLAANSLITVEQSTIQRYRCVGDRWRFWWFEYLPGEPLPLVCQVVFPVRRLPGEEAQLEEIFVKLQHHAEAERRIAAAAFSLLLQRWFAEVRRHGRVTPEQQVLETVIDRIRRNPEVSWRVPQLAAESGFCETRFRREFQKATGYSPVQFILRTRLHAAVPMIEQGIYTLEGIAGQLGFSSAFHLSAAFKKVYGTSPSKFWSP